MADDRERRRARWLGIAGLSATRLRRRAVRIGSGRLAATIAAVALTIALLLMVTGIALGLADGGIDSRDDADVRITPEDERTLSAVDGVEEPNLGATNERAEMIRSQDGVDHASPVLVEPVRLESADGEAETVLLVGVVPDGESRTVAGLSTTGLEPGDPHYAEGSYDGPREGAIVLSESAAERLDATADDELALSSVRADGKAPTVVVADVEAATEGGDSAPVALAHLSELQSASGAADGELADRILVWGESESAAAAAADAYPDAAVESTGTGNPSSLFDDGLAFATSALALIVGVAICASFVATTMGMTVNEDRAALAILAAVGFPTHSRLAIVAFSTALTTLCGALLGIALGVGGIHVVNAVAGATVASGAVAAMHPLFVPYAIAVALVSGLIAVPYPLAVAARTTILAEVER
ncbi:ABC transporter permease [Natronococcus wangiae]|uniref:ABC transporter permease n=1 Tax=Natronococcus wangiae TaxID=3068275 RepID=UPI00273EED2F|nr:FtsX-like permease family protein [Natronococcus sp. AD5]